MLIYCYTLLHLAADFVIFYFSLQWRHEDTETSVFIANFCLFVNNNGIISVLPPGGSVPEYITINYKQT